MLLFLGCTSTLVHCVSRPVCVSAAAGRRTISQLHARVSLFILLSYVKVKVKVKVWTLVIAPLTWVRLMTSSALQSPKWQLHGMSQWYCSALFDHPLPALTDNLTNGAASRHTIAPISHTRPSPRSRSYYSFPVLLRVGGCVGLSTYVTRELDAPHNNVFIMDLPALLTTRFLHGNGLVHLWAQ